MPAPGISVVEIWNALAKIKEIIDGFRDGPQNAGGILAEFDDELHRLEQSLNFQAQFYDRRSREYPGLAAFKAKLEECVQFVREKHRLLEQHNGKPSFKGVLQTVLAAFEGRIPELRRAIAYNRLELMDWKLDELYDAAFARAEQPVAASASQPSTSTYHGEDGSILQDGDQLQQDINNLVKIIYAHSRLQGGGNLAAATQLQLTPSSDTLSEDELAVQRLNARLWTTVASICRHGNVPADYRPPMVSLQALSRHLASSRQRANIQNSSGTARYASRSSMIFPRSARIAIGLSADGTLRAPSLKAAGYIFIGRQFIFLNAAGEPIYEHRMKAKTKPFTQRRRPDQNEERNVVEFREKQDVSILRAVNTSRLPLFPGGELTNSGIVQHEETFNVFPQYVFLGEDRQKHYLQFQGDVRGLTLVREFHVDSLRSKKSSAGNDADQVRVKLWKNEERPEMSLLSSLAQFRDWAVLYEWPLRWFEEPGVRGELAVRLEFTSPTTQSPEASPNPVVRWVRAILKLNRRSSSYGNAGDSSSGPASEAPSIRSVDTIHGSSRHAPDNWLELIQWLEFAFLLQSDRDEFMREIIGLQNAAEQYSKDAARRQEFGVPLLPAAAGPLLPSPPCGSLLDSAELSSLLSSPTIEGASSWSVSGYTSSDSVGHNSPVLVADSSKSGQTTGSIDHVHMMDAVGSLAPAATPSTFLRLDEQQNGNLNAAQPRTLLGRDS